MFEPIPAIKAVQLAASWHSPLHLVASGVSEGQLAVLCYINGSVYEMDYYGRLPCDNDTLQLWLKTPPWQVGLARIELLLNTSECTVTSHPKTVLITTDTVAQEICTVQDMLYPPSEGEASRMLQGFASVIHGTPSNLADTVSALITSAAMGWDGTLAVCISAARGRGSLQDALVLAKSVGPGLLSAAVMTGKVSTVKLVARAHHAAGCAVGAGEPHPDDGRSPLHLAAEGAMTDIVNCLMEADPDAALAWRMLRSAAGGFSPAEIMYQRVSGGQWSRNRAPAESRESLLEANACSSGDGDNAGSPGTVEVFLSAAAEFLAAPPNAAVMISVEMAVLCSIGCAPRAFLMLTALLLLHAIPAALLWWHRRCLAAVRAAAAQQGLLVTPGFRFASSDEQGSYARHAVGDLGGACALVPLGLYSSSSLAYVLLPYLQQGAAPGRALLAAAVALPVAAVLLRSCSAAAGSRAAAELAGLAVDAAVFAVMEAPSVHAWLADGADLHIPCMFLHGSPLGHLVRGGIFHVIFGALQAMAVPHRLGSLVFTKSALLGAVFVLTVTVWARLSPSPPEMAWSILSHLLLNGAASAAVQIWTERGRVLRYLDMRAARGVDQQQCCPSHMSDGGTSTHDSCSSAVYRHPSC
uniref:Uncharacterized protein n=2 Tax=Tetraselmis sp. GSL018 TaxID=582737 RepID=A0A061QVX8_9CHLO|mmetsp:Transcript_41519/g.98395  ORF Transcript_41519/g.98395 Transcript_41519/m.98395 type:complete len:639 (-) Transcript_41519:91-2007(-)